ncbi:response regulator [Roseobacter sp. YSTF-M11]|uniref:Response regulator n=1 Tax=Roseobacter insulae TaxID=2859783 RepID=A0A9X1K1J8_9RHOB|nr:response regulator [Roseobacter insulae]MBW4706587.1 response regulator [Roseobacter insulae]
MQQLNEAIRQSAPTRTCLIVEDSSFDQERIKRILDKSFKGVFVAVAATIEDARQHMSRYQTSFILLDNNLPDGTGANFAIELAQNPDFARIPIVIVSDWPTPFMFDKAQSAGVIHVVSKSDFGARYIHAAMNHRVQPKRMN